MADPTSIGCPWQPVRLLVAVPRPWAASDIHEVLVWPGMTARCVVERLGLPGRRLVQLGREVIVLAEDAELVQVHCIYDGARLFAL